MSSGILENDNLFVVGRRAWHGLGKVLENPPTTEDAIVASGLNWNVKQEKLVTESGIELPNLYANVREDTKGILGTVTKKYKIVQNLEAFDFCDYIKESTNSTWESGGSLFNGKKVWLLLKLDNSKILDDDVEHYMCFSNSHDGKSSIRCVCTDVRVVCNNTLQFALESATRSWSIRHVGDIKGKQEEAMKSLGLANDYIKETNVFAEKMASEKISNAERFLLQLIADETDDSDRIKSNNAYVRNSILKIYNDKDDLQNFRGTKWGMYNAVADYWSNSAPLRNAPTYKENKMNQFITNSPLLYKAQSLLMVA